MRGWYNMACWNGLSKQQQHMLINQGVLPAGHWEPAGGTCPNGAEIAIETQNDMAPGPRFFCPACAVIYLLTYRDKDTHGLSQDGPAS